MAELSFPKEKINIVLFEGVHESAIECFARDGYVNVERVDHALTGADLHAVLANAHMIGIRSRTHVTAEALEHARRGQAALGRDAAVGDENVGPSAQTRHRYAEARRGAKGEIYNLGTPQNRCSILELAEEVRNITGTSSEIRFVDPRQIYGPLYAEAHDKYPDIEKARSSIRWEPAVSRAETIRQTFEYMSALPEPIFEQLRGF